MPSHLLFPKSACPDSLYRRRLIIKTLWRFTSSPGSDSKKSTSIVPPSTAVYCFPPSSTIAYFIESSSKLHFAGQAAVNPRQFGEFGDKRNAIPTKCLPGQSGLYYNGGNGRLSTDLQFLSSNRFKDQILLART